MPEEQPDKLVFPANIHQIAADIRRQALQHPDRDPIVPGAPRRPAKPKKATRTSAKRKKTVAKAGKKSSKTRARKKSARRK